MNYLCHNLKLSIQWIHNNQLRLTLANDLSLDEVQLDLEVRDPTLRGGSRAYQNREAIIIGMRRLLNAALKAGLILDYPGTSQTSKDGGEVDPTISSIAEESLLQP